MKKKILIILILIIVLLCGIVAIINISKLENKKINNKQPIYTHSASCYSGYGKIGNAVLELKGNEAETKVIGRTVKEYSSTESEKIIADKLGIYNDPELVTKEIVKEVLYTQTQKIDKFTINEIDRISGTGKYIYEINFEYTANKSFQEYVDSIENVEKSDYRFICIIDDDNEFIGTWHGIDNNFVYNVPYNINITFNSSNTGKLYASKVDNAFPQDKEYIIKYNVIGSKIKVVYLQKDIIKNIEYLAWKGSKEFDIENNNISYVNYGQKVILNKLDN